MKCRYYKQKNSLYCTYVVSNENEIERFIGYRKDTWKLHNGTGRVFWQWRPKYSGKGKKKKKIGYYHHKQPLGKNWFYTYPKAIAKALDIPDSDTFSGHSICHSGATIIADDGATVMELQKYGNWKSASVAKKYNGQSMKSKKKFASVFANISSQNGDNKENTNSHNKNKRSYTEMTSENDNVVSVHDQIEPNEEENVPSKKRKLSPNEMDRVFSNCNNITFSNCTIKF